MQVEEFKVEEAFLGFMSANDPDTAELIFDDERNKTTNATEGKGGKEDGVAPPDNKVQTSDEKCSDFLNSGKSRSYMVDPSKSVNISHDSGRNTRESEKRFFRNDVPDGFAELCISALQTFVIRRETVITKDFLVIFCMFANILFFAV